MAYSEIVSRLDQIVGALNGGGNSSGPNSLALFCEATITNLVVDGNSAGTYLTLNKTFNEIESAFQHGVPVIIHTPFVAAPGSNQVGEYVAANVIGISTDEDYGYYVYAYMGGWTNDNITTFHSETRDGEMTNLKEEKEEDVPGGGTK